MSASVFKNIKDSLNKFQPLLPILIMIGVISNTYASVFLVAPILLELFELILKTVKIDSDNYKLDVLSHDPHDQFMNSNKFFNLITYVLEDHNLLFCAKKIRTSGVYINANQKYKVGGCTVNMSNPIISPSPGFKCTFKHHNFTVEIELSEVVVEKDKNLYGYTISAQKKCDLSAFIEYTKGMEIEYYKNMYLKDKAPVMYQYNKPDFQENTINVKKNFNNIFLDRLIKDRLKKQLDAFVNGEDRYNELGIAYRTGYLFHGTPGNGKSSLIFALAHEYRRDLYKINLSLPKNEFLQQIKKVNPNSIVIFEDIDTCSITHRREEKDKSEIDPRIDLGDLLEVLDGYCYLNGCIIIMTTNHINKLDSALIRPGRIDHKIELTNASSEQITDIIKYFFNRDFKEHTSLNISVSELINTIILPNLDNYETVYEFLINGNKFK